MTIKEALDRGIKKIRLSKWEPGAFLELPILEGRGYGPWGTVYDSASPQGMSVLITDLLRDTCSDYEEIGG